MKTSVDSAADAGSHFTLSLRDFPHTDPTYENWCRMRIVKDIKESVFQISENGSPGEAVEYEMPDGNRISIGDERFTIPEVLMFN
jgi:hypothetical protein